MKKAILIFCLIFLSFTLKSQHHNHSVDREFTRNILHRYYNPSDEFVIFTASWNNLVNTYLLTSSFSNRLSSITSLEIPTNNPEVLLSQYYEKINDLNVSFLKQQEANNFMIDRSIRGLGEVVAGIAQQNKVTTKSALLDYIIKETVISAAQENAKEKNAAELERQRSELQNKLEAQLSDQMAVIRDEILSDNSKFKDQYLEAMVYEADNSKEKYYSSCYDYYDCFINQIHANYSYKSTTWCKPDCNTPQIDYSTSINKGDFVDVAFRKLDLYRKYKNDAFLKGINMFLDAGLSENKKNPKAYFLKAELENDVIEKLFFIHLALSLEPDNTDYKARLNEVDNLFTDDLFQAIRNDDINFVARSIEKGFHLGREKNGRSPIEFAIDYDKATILGMLIDGTPDIKNTLNEKGYGLLFYASAVDALEAVKRLISYGINPDLADNNNSGLTALNIAQKNNSEKVTPFLALNYDIKPALLYMKNSEQEDLENFSDELYKIVPSKLNEICSLNADFKLKNFSNIDIQTNFNDAEIFINGEKIGTGKADLSDCYINKKYYLKIAKDGFSTEEKNFELKPGCDLIIKAKLQKSPKPLKNYLVLKDLGYSERNWNSYYTEPEGLKKETKRNKEFNQSLRDNAKNNAIESAKLYNEKVKNELEKRNAIISSENAQIKADSKVLEEGRLIDLQYVVRGIVAASQKDYGQTNYPNNDTRTKNTIKKDGQNTNNNANTPGIIEKSGIRIVENPPDINPDRKNTRKSGNSGKDNLAVNEKDENNYTGDYGIFIDSRDKNQYSWVRINNKIWMSQNLAFVPVVKSSAWLYGTDSIIIGADNKSNNTKNNGLLYAWQTAMESCPVGWRIPTDLEWSQLENYLDNTIVDFNQTSYRGTNIGSKLVKNQASSMNACFGGKRSTGGQFIGIGTIGTYWTSTQSDGSKIWYRQIQKNLPQIIRFNSEANVGYSVRCIKND